MTNFDFLKSIYMILLVNLHFNLIILMMKFSKIILAVAILSFIAIGCKNEAKKEVENQKEAIAGTTEEANFTISGMTCEMGCAKTIESKLAKKDGVMEATVIFNDSTAVVKYDANKTSKKELIEFIDGIADGETYRTSEKILK